MQQRILAESIIFRQEHRELHIWKIEVEDFPAFILVDDKGNDFFQQIQNKQCKGCSQR